jgi:ribonuclease P/MRP protein subunit POP7
VKRIRKLLSEISNRAAQSSSALSKLKPRGRLDPKDVERAIASESGAGKGKEGGVGGEEVFVKGTGRAIERALAIGVRFQREADCRVRVELGSVRAIDDIEAEADVEGEEDDGGGEAAERMDVDGGDEQQKKRKKKKRALRDEDIPETRIRSMSAVTVAISLR